MRKVPGLARPAAHASTRWNAASRTGAPRRATWPGEKPLRAPARSSGRRQFSHARIAVTILSWLTGPSAECVLARGARGGRVSTSKSAGRHPLNRSSVRRSRSHGVSAGCTNRSVRYLRSTVAGVWAAARRLATSSITVVKSLPLSPARRSTTSIPPTAGSTRPSAPDIGVSLASVNTPPFSTARP